MSPAAATEVFAFAGFSLDARQRLLFGRDGKSVPLSARAFDTLLYLVEHPNQLIDKQALMKAVWPNAIVDESTRLGTIGATPLWQFLWEPEMRPFRRDPRFQAFVTHLKLFDYWKQYGPPDECELKDEKLTCS
jgi:hypothetical protein